MPQQIARGERPEGGIIFDGLASGLVYPVIGVQLIDDDANAVIIARTDDDLVERGGGTYIWHPLIPADTPLGTYRAQIDNDSGTAAEGHTANVSVQIVAALLTTLTPTDYTPSIEDVAAWIRTRTKDTVGNELGTFNDNTRPTDDEVRVIIQNAQDRVGSFVDGDIPDAAFTYARNAIGLMSAMMIELSYFPEQIGTGKSPYEQLRALYEGQDGNAGAIAQLYRAVEREKSEEEMGTTDDRPTVGSWGDATQTGMIGMDTRW